MKILSVTLEVIGVAAIGVGIGVELATGADTGWVMVTTGSCLVAIGGVIWGKFMHRSDGR
jgi:hypothetical protein